MSQLNSQNGENLNDTIAPGGEHPAGDGSALQNGHLFCRVFQNPDLLKRFLQQVAELEVEEVRYCSVLDEEKIVQDPLSLVQAEIDIHGKRSFAVVQLLTEPLDDLPVLARFYAAHVDRWYGFRGGEDNLPEDIYVVFLCNYDPMGDVEKHGFARYTFVSVFEGTDIPAPELYRLFLLNTHYTAEPDRLNVPEEVLELLDYIRTGDDTKPAQGELLKLVLEGVRDAQASTHEADAGWSPKA